jgi:uncharacterized membrane protein
MNPFDGLDLSSDYNYSGDSGSGTGNAIADIISAATPLATTALVASQAPGAIQSGAYIPAAGNATPSIVGGVAQTVSMTSILWIVVLAIAAIFIFHEID